MTSIETRNLTMVYTSRRGGPVVAVEDLDLSIPAGEVFGLLGPNGAGKTTTIRMLCGLIRPTRGTIRVDGIDLAERPHDVRRRVALVPEDAGDFRNLTLLEELDYYGALYGLDRATVRRRSEALLERLGLADRRNDLLKTFSRGMRRKFHLVRAVLHEPRVLLLDEPTAGLDPDIVQDVWDLLKGLARERQVTVVLCSHHLEEVERLCDRVGILRRRLVVEGRLAELSGAHRTYRVRLAGSANGCAETVAGVAGVARVERVGGDDGDGQTLHVHVDREPATIIPELVRRLVAAGAGVIEVAPHGRDLRSLYRDAIVGEEGGAAGAEGPHIVSPGIMRLMRTMVLKEIRTMLRERHQKTALSAVFVLALVGILVPTYKWKTFVDYSRAEAEKSEAAVASARAGTQPSTAEATPTTEAFAFVLAAAAPSQADLIRTELLSNNAAVVRWIILLGTALGAMLFSLGLIGNAAIAAFAGEKEAKTLELALASPVSDGALFIGKTLAAIVPALAFCYLLILLATCGVWLLLRGELATLPVNVPLHTLVLSVPLILLPSVALALIGVAGSARAETVKGAGQVIGITVIVLVVGATMLPLLLRFTPIGPAAARAGRAWLQWPFAAQYLGLLAVLIGADAILFAIGRAMVSRQRMLV